MSDDESDIAVILVETDEDDYEFAHDITADLGTVPLLTSAGEGTWWSKLCDWVKDIFYPNPKCYKFKVLHYHD